MRKHIKCRALWTQCQQHVCTKNGRVDHVPAQPCVTTLQCAHRRNFSEEKLGIVESAEHGGKVENNQAGAITMPTMLEYTPMAGPHDLERGHTLSRRGGAENQRLEERPCRRLSLCILGTCLGRGMMQSSCSREHRGGLAIAHFLWVATEAQRKRSNRYECITLAAWSCPSSCVVLCTCIVLRCCACVSTLELRES